MEYSAALFACAALMGATVVARACAGFCRPAGATGPRPRPTARKRRQGHWSHQPPSLIASLSMCGGGGGGGAPGL